MNNPYHYAIQYESHINYIDVDQTWGILKILGFPVSIEQDFYSLCEGIEKLGSLYCKEYVTSTKILKDLCESLWLFINRQLINSTLVEEEGQHYYIKNPKAKVNIPIDMQYWLPEEGDQQVNMATISIVSTLSSLDLPLGSYQRMVHTILRAGEFLYISDDTMQDLTKDINDFIESGDCKLFDYDSCPYKGEGLKSNLRQDIINQEKNVQEYNRRNNLAELSARDIISAIDKLIYFRDHPGEAPENLRGVLYNLRDISDALSRDGLNGLDFYYRNGIPEEDMFHKMSGSGYNKEEKFQKMTDHYEISSFKNPETTSFRGRSDIPVPKGALFDTFQPKCLKDFLMDVIWYSIGKGPWLKTRYVGQCTSYHQSLLSPYERITKRILKRNHQWFLNKEELKESNEWTKEKINSQYSNDSIYIYDNSDRLKELISKSSDLISSDFSSYTDYMNRNLLIFICRNLLLLPEENCQLISNLFSMPVRINGINYSYKWGSVMGLKFNFLLITIANWVMWAIGTIIAGNSSAYALFMGDDRIEGTPNPKGFSKEYLEIQLGVCSYMNCVINMSKTEWLNRDGFSSFCKIYHNCLDEEISGFGGESLLKQKIFLNDISAFIKDSFRRDFYLDNAKVDQLLKNNIEQLVVGYSIHQKLGDPDLLEMIAISKKISFRYGGLNTEEPDEIQDRLNMSAILATINTIMMEDLTSFHDKNRTLVREYLIHNLPHGEDNIFYQSLLNNVLRHDYDKINECIIKVQKVLNQSISTTEEIRSARNACQRLQEIVLDRDSRLSNSISTKNRTNPNFDVDRVSKIRNYHYKEVLEDNRGYLNSLITTSAMQKSLEKDIPYKDTIQDIMSYYNMFKSCNSGLQAYTRYNQCSSFIGMVVHRECNGEDKILLKRITADDSYYKTYGMGTSLDQAEFISRNSLTEEEGILFDRIIHDDYLRNNLMVVARRLDEEIEDCKTYIRSYLLDSLTKEVANLFN